MQVQHYVEDTVLILWRISYFVWRIKDCGGSDVTEFWTTGNLCVSFKFNVTFVSLSNLGGCEAE